MTILVANNQPLREREERWIAFRDEGIFKTYGEYIGSVAQQFNMQSARRVSPYPFTYGTIQMMLKDGGVCGTMGNISARSHISLGIPACTAGQPGHCAMIAYRYNEKEKFYYCKGGQYATGGDDKTTPHAGWFFGDDVVRERTKRGVTSTNCVHRSMIYHQSIAFAVNYGMKEFLDSIMAYNIFNLLPENERGTNGLKMLACGMNLNPYNFLITDTILKEADDPALVIRIWKNFDKLMAAVKNKPGCPPDGLYNKTVKTRMFARLNELPVPSDKLAAYRILKFLEVEQCDYPATLAGYRLKLDGVPVLQQRTEKDFIDHLAAMHAQASRDNDINGEKMAGALKAVVECIKDKKVRKRWAGSLLELAKGRAMYFGHRNRVALDPAVQMLSRLSGQKLPPENELMAPVIKKISEELAESVSHARTVKECKVLAHKINSVCSVIKAPELKREMIDSLIVVMKGKESFKQKGASKSQRDPCIEILEKLRASLDG